MAASTLALLRLVRAGTLFSPAADVLAGACLAGAPWSVALVRGMAASVCVYAAGMVLNDHADRARDAIARPERPLPRGEIAASTALLLGLALAAAGIAIAPWPAWWLSIAVLVVLYDYVLSRAPWPAALTMGALRAMNLLAGTAVAAHALSLERAVVIAAAAYALYTIALTVLGRFEDEPRVAPRAVLAVQTVPVLAAPAALLAQPQPWPAAAVALALAAAFALRTRRIGTAWDRAAIRGSMTWLLIGMLGYASLLCLAAGRVRECLGIALAIPIARAIARRIALT